MDNLFQIITTNPCNKCDATKRRFKKYDIPFESVPKEEAEDLVEQARAAGANMFPIVIAPNGDWWFDFRIDKIDEYGKSQEWRNSAA